MDENTFNNLVTQNHLQNLISLVLETGPDVFLDTFNLFYTGPYPAEDHLLELANNKTNGITQGDKRLLEHIKLRKRALHNLDITLLYKVIKVSCGLTPPSNDNCVWSKFCPEDKKNYIEHLLFRYKDHRNTILHEFRYLRELSDTDLEEYLVENKNILHSIIREAGKKANLPEQKVNRWLQQITEHEGFQKTGKYVLAEKAPLFVNTYQEFPNMFMSLGSIFYILLRKSRSIINESQSLVTTQIDKEENNKNPMTQGKKSDDEEGDESIDERFNRQYWIQKLTSSNALQDIQKLESFWKEYSDHNMERDCDVDDAKMNPFAKQQQRQKYQEMCRLM